MNVISFTYLAKCSTLEIFFFVMVGSWAVLKIKDSKLITKQLFDIFAYMLSTCVHFKMPGKQKFDDKSESDYTCS